MFKNKSHFMFTIAAMAAMTTAATSAHAAVFTVDGTPATYQTLSAAVTAAQATEDGPDVINITVDSLPTADGEIVITQPLTINGNADGTLIGPGTKCDILFDMATVKAAASSLGQPEKCFIEIQTTGEVVINDLKIHPNAEGGAAVASEQADAVRMYRPASGLGNYTFNRVWISGSNSSTLAYVPLDSGADLYNSGVYKWGGSTTAGNGTGRAVLQMTEAPGTALGNYNATLNNCHVGLGQSAAMNIPNGSSIISVNSGVYGHSARDGIRVSATTGTITIKGTSTDRLRVIRVPNISGGDAHGVELAAAKITLMEYVDVATINSGQNLKMNGASNIQNLRFCRFMGKVTPGINAIVYLDAGASVNAEDITAHGNGTVTGGDANPFQAPAGTNGTIAFTDSIFTSAELGSIIYANSDAQGTLSFTNCALPTQGEADEILATPPITGAAAAAVTLNPNPQLAVSPNYLLQLADYDWSDVQGALDALNGPGNRNVYRPNPTNLPYLTGATGGQPLTGGAGPAVSGIDSSDWMMM